MATSSSSPMPNITSIKLTDDNYPLQKAQLVPYFRGQELYGYLDGKIPNPLPFITTIHPDTRELTQIANAAYSHWVRHENLILSTLTSSITEGVLTQVISYTTSHVVWQALAVHFFSESKAHQVTLEEAYSLLIVTEARLARHHLSTPIPEYFIK
ncbi:hypothetical protein POTOM_033458 [Populus tomentosa]|uniref:Uncharacterized protein n=1 Tax=Populus tomentosa TaxID=118781 RepID=A0A8X7Z5T9_POPTO|nr:hypothetical protein POTOM_033458 [Populus tomentosa]